MLKRESRVVKEGNEGRGVWSRDERLVVTMKWITMMRKDEDDVIGKERQGIKTRFIDAFVKVERTRDDLNSLMSCKYR